MVWNWPFPSCCKPHYQSEAKCKVFIMEISFHSCANKTNFHMESFAISLAYKMRFTATRKWPIGGLHCRHVGVQNKRKFVHIVRVKMEVYSQKRKILLFLYTNMAAMTSHANH